MDNPEKLATYGIQVQEKQNKTICGESYNSCILNSGKKYPLLIS
jgi:predicted class III extradiol MEMO1 family dioxygenase